MKRRVALFDPTLPLPEREAIEISNLVVRRHMDSTEGRAQRRLGQLWFALFGAATGVPLIMGAPFWYAILVGLAVFVGAGIVVRRAGWDQHAKRFRAELRARGHDICLSCGTWLGGLGGSVTKCPECGAERLKTS